MEHEKSASDKTADCITAPDIFVVDLRVDDNRGYSWPEVGLPKRNGVVCVEGNAKEEIIHMYLEQENRHLISEKALTTTWYAVGGKNP
ncbi:hypothetical protein CDAR_558511 [Caerostris darwini]|uniref:Uncharacterized protein n=1 Tax=Caerostris darwini TaxID=1538125 RepID=A0AAV4S6V2_9ARAC|nr:hypothetical protein CDAR_558511 [Caerostris darwini]